VICCLCGRRIEEGELFISIGMYRYRESKMTGEAVRARVKLEDGSVEKVACPTCPVLAGAPLELIGAGSRIDV
jgi:hypothetical protein